MRAAAAQSTFFSPRLRRALGVAATLQLATWLITLFSLGLLSTEASTAHGSRAGLDHAPLLQWVAGVSTRWDAVWYQRIADHGYRASNHTLAFFPLYPLLLRCAHTLMPMGLAVFVISFSATAVTVATLLRLAPTLPGVDDRTALGAVALWAAFPTAAFLVMGYPESLLAAFVACAWLAATRGRIWTWAVLAGCALLTRPLGVAALPLLLCAPRESRTWARTGAALVLAALIASVWPLYQWTRFGSPIAFIHAQAHWSRGVHASPIGVFQALRGAATGLHGLFVGQVPNVARHGLVVPQQVRAGLENDLQLLFAILLASGAVLAWRRFGAGPGLSVLCVLVVPLLSTNPNVPLLSLPRFCLTALPIFPAFALTLRSRPDLRIVAAAISGGSFALYTAAIALERFVS